MDVSARHVGVVGWAAGLERMWRANEAAGHPPLLGLEHAWLVTAVPTLVFASAITAIDQCVAAAAFHAATGSDSGTKKNGNWYATGDLTASKPPPFQTPAWFPAWFDTLAADSRWDLTKPFRNRQLHQVQSRSVVIAVPTIYTAAVAGGEPTPLPPPTSPPVGIEQFGAAVVPGGRNVADHYDEVRAFTLEHWSAFWKHFSDR